MNPPAQNNDIICERVPGLEACVKRAMQLVGSKYGVIQKFEFEDLEPGEPPVFFARTFPSKMNPLNNAFSINYGDAVSTDRNRALMKSLGECIERYSSAFIDKSKLIEESFNGLKKIHPDIPPVDLKNLEYFLPEQYEAPGFPFSILPPDKKIHWVQCHSLKNGKPKWVPAQSVFIPFPGKEYGDLSFCDQISTGMACGPDRVSSIYKGILEVIERDAFMVNWLNKISPPEVEISTLKNPLANELYEALSELPVTANMYSLTLDINAYVFLMVLENKSGVAPHTVMGLGADLDPDKALILALEETLLTFIGMGRYVRAKPDFSPDPDYQNITTPTLHALAHAVCPDLKEALEFFKSPPKKLKFEDFKPLADMSDLNKGVDFLVKELEGRNLEPLFFDLTTEDIRQAGFKVARVVIPGMQPLDINHNQMHLGIKRRREVPETLGLVSNLENDIEVNPYPHAFP